MKFSIKNLIASFKEYLLLVVLLLISLSILSLNESEKVKKLKAYAFGGFAFVTNIANSITDWTGENDELLKQKRINAELMLQVSMLRQYGLENNSLRELLNFRDSTAKPLFPAEVVSKMISKARSSFILNVGRKDSIKIGMPVINEKGLVGIITNISEDFSRVRTLKNSNLKITVKNERTNINGVMGWSGKELVIRNIPTTAEMKVGDRIVISEFSTIFPPTIPVGIISEKVSTISGELSSVIVTPFVEVDAVENVFVLGVVPSKQVNELELNLMLKK